MNSYKKILLIATLIFSTSSVAGTTTVKLLKEIEITKDTQKFYEIGACYAVMEKYAGSKNFILEARVKNMLKVVDLSKVKNKAAAIGFKECPNGEMECFKKSSTRGAAGFIVGWDKGNSELNLADMGKMEKWELTACGKYFNY